MGSFVVFTASIRFENDSVFRRRNIRRGRGKEIRKGWGDVWSTIAFKIRLSLSLDGAWVDERLLFESIEAGLQWFRGEASKSGRDKIGRERRGTGSTGWKGSK